ncbi:hypothetical protein QUF70_14245 [Desulfobacterales bacterium HSG17]|nr:hypothetical protein [Desulfobacterales bacterium HSG17]
MNYKSGESNSFTDGDAYQCPSDSGNHLISTSLRDLSLEYRNLKTKRVDPTDLNKKNLTKIVQETKD